jgi:hypothetical protein
MGVLLFLEAILLGVCMFLEAKMFMGVIFSLGAINVGEKILLGTSTPPKTIIWGDPKVHLVHKILHPFTRISLLTCNFLSW